MDDGRWEMRRSAQSRSFAISVALLSLAFFSLHLRRVLLLLLLLLSSSPSSRQFFGPICSQRVGGASGLYGVSDDAERRSVVRVWKEGSLRFCCCLPLVWLFSVVFSVAVANDAGNARVI
jgi:hypothetical protein